MQQQSVNSMLKGIVLCTSIKDSHIRQFHDHAIATTLSETQNLFDSTCSDRIWKMMDKEFISTKNAILNSEMKQTKLQSPSLTSCTLSLVPSQ